MPRRTFFKLFGQIGQDATALSNSIAWMTYRRFSSTRRFTRYGVTYTEDSGDKSPIIKSSSEEYMNWQDEFQKRCGIRPMELRSLYTDPENIKPIEGLNESQVMPKYEEDEKTPVYLKNDKGEFMLDKNGKKIPDTVEYFFSLPQQQPVGKAGGLVKTAFDTAPKCVLAKNFEIASDYAKELKGQPGRVSIAYQFYKGRLYNFNLKQLEILYPELKPTSKELDENNEPTDAYWDRAVEKLKSIYGEDCAERSKNSIKISGVVNGHISLIIDVVCKNGLRKMVASELCKPQYLYLNDDFVKPNYNDLEVPSIIYPMHKDSTTGTVGVPQDIQDWDAEYVTDRYKSDTPSLTMGKPDLLKGSVNTNGYTVMLVSHETPRAGDLAQLTLMMTGEDLFNALLTNPFYSLPSSRMQSAMCETWGTENRFLADLPPELTLLLSMGETPWDASSARREFTYADPLARILQQARASRDKSGGTKAVAQPNIFSVESANTFILNIISSRIFLMDVERLAKYMEENFDPDAGGKEIEKMRKELFLITQRSHNANQLAGAVLTKKELLDLKAIAGDRDIETIQKHCDQILYAAVRRNMRNLRKTYPDLTMDQIKGILDKMIAGGDKQ